MDPGLESARRHNDGQPISRLTADILCQIFLLHRQSFFINVSSTSTYYRYFKHEEAFSFIAVCRTWYIVAMNQAQLWSTINFRYYPAEMCIAMAKRAKGCPLDVVICLPPGYKQWPWRLSEGEKYDPDLLDIIAPLIPHMRDVYWGLSAWHIQPFLKELVRQQRKNPHLRTLEIMWDTYGLHSEQLLAFPHALLRSALSSENNKLVPFRSLSSLQLIKVHVDWDALPDSMCNDSVVELVLVPSRSKIPSAVQLARFLAKFSALRYLELRTAKFDGMCAAESNIVGSPASLCGRDGNRFRLDKLQRISVTHGSRFMYVLPLLQHLVLPETASWDIICTAVRFELDDSAGVSTLLNMITSRVTFPHVKLRGNGDRGMVTITGSFPYSSTPTLSFQLHTDDKEGLNFRMFRHVFEEIARAYPVDAMKSFEYDYVFGIEEKAYVPEDAEDVECTKWRTMLQRHGGTLEKLSVGSLFGLRCALKALTVNFEQVKTGSTTLAPNLRRFDAKIPPASSEGVEEHEEPEQALLPLLQVLAEQRRETTGDNDLVVAIVPFGRGDPVRILEA